MAKKKSIHPVSEDKELISAWDFNRNALLGFAPEKVSVTSNLKVWWKCSKCGYEWMAKVANRHYGRGCPCCSHKILVKGKNDLATLNPELAKEWDYPKNYPLKPEDVFPSEARKVWWICPKGHEYQASLLHRSGGTECPVCNSGRQTSFAEQAVLFYVRKIFPDAVSRYKGIFKNGMELDVYIPSARLGIEYDGVYWHRTPKSARSAAKKYAICQANRIKLIRIEEGPINQNFQADLALRSEEKKDWLDMTICHLLNEIDPACNMWTKKNPAHVFSDISVDTKRDRAQILAYRTGILRHSLAEERPDLAKEWDNEKNGLLRPEAFLCGSEEKVWWKCAKCGYEWRASIGHRVTGTGCPKCQNQVLEKGVNDLASQRPELLKEWDYSKNDALGLKPNEIRVGSGKMVWWKCAVCGYEWETPVYCRADGAGCRKCGHKKMVETKARRKRELGLSQLAKEKKANR